MSLFSKLFGGEKNTEIEVKNLLIEVLFGIKQNNTAQNHSQNVAPSSQSSNYNFPSGFSWGDRMPEEENQFNYNGTFVQYFENIFKTDFPSYNFEKDILRGGKRIVYTFLSEPKKCLSLS